MRARPLVVLLANTGYHFYNTGCVKDTQQLYLGNTVNQVWNYGNLNIGGNVGTHADLQPSHRYTGDGSYNNCKYKEAYGFMQSYGLVRTTYYILQSDGTIAAAEPNHL